MMKLKIGFSTCPNDTFIFDALVNGKTNTEGLSFDPFLADVEELNEKALRGELDVTKLSYHAYGHVQDQYQVLDSGSALGFGNGPLLVSSRQLTPESVSQMLIAVPGRMTTANLLLSIAFPEADNKIQLLFSDIEDALLNGRADLGVLIHETRFTFQEKGLHLVMDLGAFWEQLTGFPIPLGGIVVRRDYSSPLKTKIQRVVQNSLIHAIQNPESPLAYMQNWAQDMRLDVMDKHVKTFVNEFSLSLGESGQQAVKSLLYHGHRAGLFMAPREDIFL